MLTTVMLRTSSSLWLIASTRARTMPRSGLERESRASRIVTRTLNLSPGRKGFGHRISSTPGEAKGNARGSVESNDSRVIHSTTPFSA